MARKRSSRALLRLLGALALVALVGGAWGWWHLHHWLPPRADYPVQGVEIGAEDGALDWSTVKGIGADFAYIDASASASARDPNFVTNLEGARLAGLQVGAVHRYDPCQPAEKQAANFVTTVPRDADMLPPAVELDMTAEHCLMRVNEAKVESELMTFLNQVETHTGRATILKVSDRFEAEYGIAARIDRNLWLVRDRFEPDYAGRPWTMWTANTRLSNEIADGDLRWVVVRP
ncbi:lysozyme [Novosphingobium sp. PC22D]|uniref:glycoside hydrolase family 25 protein n=1 Tax=Novosphingobium sp. PC22D TaxID=1962403 RepID=UPI000BEF1D91|nr:glycoside hydrolase family 25 protein [Novosphingobium sp. PC22D]PEQ14604.1 lysozyme [Novosphingobium sp. PC22D]